MLSPGIGEKGYSAKNFDKSVPGLIDKAVKELAAK
jgi:hypothetical protein